MSPSSTLPACAELRASAIGIVSLGAADPERVAAERHTAECPECALALGEAASMWQLLDEGRAQTAPSEAVLRAASQAVLAELDAAPSSIGISDLALIATAALAGGGLVWAFERRAVAAISSLGELVSPLVFGVIAASLVMVSRARPRLALAALVTLSMGILVGDWSPATSGMRAVGCLGFELMAALVPLLTTAVIVGRRAGAGPLSYATAAASGAVVAEASLHLLCPHHSLGHLAAYHFGGVVLATLVGAASGAVFRRGTTGAAAA